MKEIFPTKKLGALPFQTICDLVSGGFITGATESNIKPASLDLSISDEVFRVEGMFLPKTKECVHDVLAQIPKKKHSLGQALERGSTYMIRLNEKLELPSSVYAYCNPKSTSGRIDAHVRLIADGMARYDSLRAGFKGELWLSIIPQTFPILLHKGLCLNQLRFFNSDTRLNDLELEMAMKSHRLLWRQKEGAPYLFSDIKIHDNDSSLILTLDLESGVLGYEGVPTKDVVDLSKINFYNSKKFFKPVRKNKDHLYLKKGSFYILSTHEAVRVPPHLACEMVPMDERSGDFRSHYAGFIDPGWGWGRAGEGKGRPLTLEVRPFEDLVVRQGQPIGKIKFERMAYMPEVVYDAVSSNYIEQSGPKLAKHFK